MGDIADYYIEQALCEDYWGEGWEPSSEELMISAFEDDCWIDASKREIPIKNLTSKHIERIVDKLESEGVGGIITEYINRFKKELEMRGHYYDDKEFTGF